MEKDIIKEISKELRINDEKLIKVLIKICNYYKIYKNNDIIKTIKNYIQ